MIIFALFHIDEPEANKRMVRRSNEAIPLDIIWSIVWRYNVVKNPVTSMCFLAQVQSQSEIFISRKPNFWCIVNYIQWSVKISQDNNFVEF